jgi:hypothetical protein
MCLTVFVIFATILIFLIHLIFYASFRNDQEAYLEIYFGWTIELFMCIQVLFDYCDFPNSIKQWEYEYLRDSEVRKQKELNSDGLNEI